MTSYLLTNAPMNFDTYGRTRRLRFLFAALRVKSLLARDELAWIATENERNFEQLLDAIRASVDNQDAARKIKLTRKKRAVYDLAWLLSNQIIFEHDLNDARTIYRWCLTRYGIGSFSQMHLVNLALLGMRLGDEPLSHLAAGRLRELMPIVEPFLPKVGKSFKVQALAETLNRAFIFNRDYSLSARFLKLDAENPFRGKSASALESQLTNLDASRWLSRLSRELLGKAPAQLAFDTSAKTTPLDSLRVDFAPTPVTEGPLVTIVMSTFQPNEHIFTAVRSALEQSYRNIEVLVIDDASGKKFDEILTRVAALDPRVRVLRQVENGGTYRIRNRALDEANGEFITFNDSDDWMHPERIARQVAHLQQHPTEMSNISMSTRLTDRLEAVESNRRLRVGICEPALMFRRAPVVEKIGYFDDVRKGGDTEYRKRLNKAFGQDSAVILPWRALTLQRADNGGLTQGELGFRWIAEFRTAYRDSYQHWQNRLAKDTGLRLGRGLARTFYAPRQSYLASKVAREARSFDLVLAANLRDPANAVVALARIEKAIKAGLKIGLLQLNTMYPLALDKQINRAVLDQLNAGAVELVYPHDALTIAVLDVMAPSAWLSSYHREQFAFKVASLKSVKLEKSTETWVADGEGLAGLLQQQLTDAFGIAPKFN